MRKAFLLAIPLLLAILAGCADGDSDKNTDDTNLPPATGLYAGPALWADPQNAPHGLYNWPTLANPPAAGTPGVPAWWAPIQGAELPADVSGVEHVLQVPDVPQGAGIAIFGSIAVVPDDASTAYLVDISDPASAHVVSSFESSGRGAAILAYPNGRVVTALATTSGFDLADISDPEHPVLLNPVAPSQGGHKLGIVPGTPFLYNAASGGGAGGPITPGPGPGQLDPSLGTGYTEIYDLTDPESPVLVQEFANGYSCHHIFFWNNAAENKYRALCAGLEYTQIWDTADPAHPEVIVSIPVHYGVANGPSMELSLLAFSHSAGMNIAGDVLYVGDESGGGGIPPGCVLGIDTPLGNVATPIGATWFYDVSDETNPQLLGYYSPLNDPLVKNPATSCTTHHGRLIPVPDKDLLAMSYYGDGVIIVDFTDIGIGTLPKTVAQYVDNSNTWETWYDAGYLFTGDLDRGMDVLKIV